MQQSDLKYILIEVTGIFITSLKDKIPETSSEKNLIRDLIIKCPSRKVLYE